MDESINYLSVTRSFRATKLFRFNLYNALHRPALSLCMNNNDGYSSTVRSQSGPTKKPRQDKDELQCPTREEMPSKGAKMVQSKEFLGRICI